MRTALNVQHVRAGPAALAVEGEDINAAKQRGLLDDTGRKAAARATHSQRFYRPGLTTPGAAEARPSAVYISLSG